MKASTLYNRRDFLKVTAKIKRPIIAGKISRKQVNPSFGLIIDQSKVAINSVSRR